MKNITKKHFRYTLYCGKIKLFRVDMGILCFVSLNAGEKSKVHLYIGQRLNISTCQSLMLRNLTNYHSGKY